MDTLRLRVQPKRLAPLVEVTGNVEAQARRQSADAALEVA
jgi:hypothetical protein